MDDEVLRCVRYLFTNNHTEEKFPFFKLPLLLQWKIVRQYISLTDKIHILSTISEFSNLLPETLSKEKLKFLEWIRLLKPGIYFNPAIPEYRIEISFDEKNLTLSICYISHKKTKHREFKSFITKTRLFSTVLLYLNQLKQETKSSENIITYNSKNYLHGCITIDHNLNSVYRGSWIYKLESNECFIASPLINFICITNNQVFVWYRYLQLGKFIPIIFFPIYHPRRKRFVGPVTHITLTVKDNVEIRIKQYGFPDNYIERNIYAFLNIKSDWM